jgi:hypothetical protein
LFVHNQIVLTSLRLPPDGIVIVWLLVLGCLVFFYPVTAYSQEVTAQEYPVEDINEGALVFITPEMAHAQSAAVLYSTNHIDITGKSLDDHWVTLQQCYQHLNTALKSEITYRYRNMRKLTIERIHNIGQAKIMENSVYLDNVSAGAEICVSAEIQILYENEPGQYLLRNGPFFNRLIDGYFPMNVTMQVDFPQSLLRLVESSPAPQSGFKSVLSEDGIDIDAWFEGKLTIELHFMRLP